MSSGMDERADGAPEVAHDVLWLGVVGGLLVQELDAWHLAPGLAHLDAVDHVERQAGYGHALRVFLDDCGPLAAQYVYVEGAGVEEVEQVVVLERRQPHAAHDAC